MCRGVVGTTAAWTFVHQVLRPSTSDSRASTHSRDLFHDPVAETPRKSLHGLFYARPVDLVVLVVSDSEPQFLLGEEELAHVSASPLRDGF